MRKISQISISHTVAAKKEKNVIVPEDRVANSGEKRFDYFEQKMLLT